MTSAPKRTTQWVGAVLILAVMVFGLTFAMNYLDQGPSRPGPKPKAPEIEFTAPVYPSEDKKSLVWEHKQDGFHDFRFSNPGEKDVTLGLRYAGVRRDAREPSDLSNRGLRVELYCESGQPSPPPAQPLTTEESRTIPGRSTGWVRLHWSPEQLHWSAEQPEPRFVEVGLWTDRPQNNQTILLKVNLVVVRPLLAEKETRLGTTDVQSLPRSWPVYCFSATRPDLQVKAEVEQRGGRPAKSDPLQVEAVERLGDAECREQEKRIEGVMNIRCAYRVTVKLRDVSPDGTTPVELGPFQRILTLTCPGTDVKQRVVLSGSVQGDVTVGTRSDGGVVHLPPFRPGEEKEAEKTVLLQSDVAGLELEVDAARTPAILEVPPLEEPEVVFGHRTWKLVVKVRPNQVFGPLPADCAVYVKRKGGTPRTIRIPVVGTANSG